MQKEIEDSIKNIWQQFKTDIISKNRYFAGNNILTLLDKFYMIDMFPASSKIDFYRARIGDFTKQEISSLLAPPKGKASAGRCNPEGISYLYLSSYQKTAVAEVRPNCGDIVSVAKFKVDVSKIFSFRVYFQGLPLPLNPNSHDSLFLIKLIDNDLASKVTKERKLDYIPFQYVSEYIKNKGFIGFVYSSTVGPGMNLVLFDWEEKIELIERKVIKIKNVHYDY
jgi:hypothetical protein